MSAVEELKRLIAEKAEKARTQGHTVGDINAKLLLNLKSVNFKPTIPTLNLPPVKPVSMFATLGQEKVKPRPGMKAEDLFPSLGKEEEGFVKPKRTGSPGVTKSTEFLRIANLPRRPWGSDGVPDLTEELRKPGGTMQLRPVQNWALNEMKHNRGALCAVMVGGGKTAISLLAPVVMKSPSAILLVPPQVKEQLMSKDVFVYGKHFNINLARTKIVSYSELSNAKTADVLERLQPELIVADECHLLKDQTSARVRRFNRYFKAFPKTRFVGLSGTITRKSIKDYAHLAELALRDGSPLPWYRYFNELMDWAQSLDVSEDPLEPGALIDFCSDEEKRIISLANPRDPEDRRRAQAAVRAGYRRRLVETPGFVATEEGAIGTSLVITGLYPKVPDDVDFAIKKLRAEWVIAEDELTEATAVARVARQLAAGFYYRWIWPEGKVNREWLEARSNWNKEVRGFLKRSRPGLDSPMLVARAARKREIKTQFWVAWGEEPIGGEVLLKNGKTRPRTFKDLPNPPRETVWINDYMLKHVAEWAKHVKKTAPAIIWYEHTGFGEALEKLTGLPRFGSGEEASRTIIHVDAKKTSCIIASRQAHGTGKNLQQFSRNLFTTPMPGGVDWEQCLDSETEILTNGGWKSIDDAWEEQDLAAAYDIKNGTIHWSKAKRVERPLGDEFAYGIETPRFDLRVTAGHNMVARQQYRKGKGGCDGHQYQPAEFVPAAALKGQFLFPVAGYQDRPGVPLTHDQLVFIGLFMTDGHLDKHGALTLFQSDKYPEVVQLINETIDKCGFTYRLQRITTGTNFGPRKHTLNKWALYKNFQKQTGWAPLSPYLSKNLSPLLENMTRDQLLSLLKGMWAGDGFKTRGTHDYRPFKEKTFVICGKRKDVMDKLQSLCVRSGISANVLTTERKLHHLSYCPTSTENHLATVKMETKRPRWGRVDASPEERFWCVSVDTGAIVVRRNGKVAVVGNCLGRTHRPGQDADLVEADVYLHTSEMLGAFQSACNQASYTESTQGQKQKLLYATKVNCEG